MMKKRINIEKLRKSNPYKVPDDYFTSLTHNIMDKIDEKETVYFLDLFRLKTLTPTLAIISIVFAGFWYNNQKPNITNEDLIELLSFYQLKDELLLEYIEPEIEENTDEYLLNEFNYNEIIYEL